MTDNSISHRFVRASRSLWANPTQSIGRLLPLLVFVVVALIGAGVTHVVLRSERAVNAARFERAADDAVDRFTQRLNEHITLLMATRSLFVANNGVVTRTAFSEFVDSLELESRYAGVQGLGFTRLLPPQDDFRAEAALKANYGIERPVWPQTDQLVRAPVLLLEPADTRNLVALGYDMYSEAVRRRAMDEALETGTVRASGPVELVVEITGHKQSGFLLFLPFEAAPRPEEEGEPSEPVTGLVYAAFRAGDLHEAALQRSPQLRVLVETFDVTDGNRLPIYRDPGFSDQLALGGFETTRVLDIAGRQWQINVRSQGAFFQAGEMLTTLALVSISLMLALALAAFTYSQRRALEAAQRLNAISEKSMQEKDMMLQEMKHRIKNSIARVLAMARQTAANSESLAGFSESFSARLQAMSNAQDMLTRSYWRRAKLRELLESELGQVFGDNLNGAELSGPDIDISETVTQALGLTFHELATNAIKYGGISEENGSLSVSWQVTGGHPASRLEIDWRERSPRSVTPPEKSGFGTRLIDANIRGELGGTIERDFDGDGLSIKIVVPLDHGR